MDGSYIRRLNRRLARQPPAASCLQLRLLSVVLSLLDGSRTCAVAGRRKLRYGHYDGAERSEGANDEVRALKRHLESPLYWTILVIIIIIIIIHSRHRLHSEEMMGKMEVGYHSVWTWVLALR